MLYIYTDSKVNLEKFLHEETSTEDVGVVSESSDSNVSIQAIGEVTAAERNNATKKERKEEDWKKKEARIATANKMAEAIFRQAECMKYKALAEELSEVKRELQEKQREVKEKEQQLSESQEKLTDVSSSLLAKKRQAKRVKPSGEFD